MAFDLTKKHTFYRKVYKSIAGFTRLHFLYRKENEAKENFAPS